MTTISIIGCGWLGLPLGQQLVRAGYAVHGTTTTAAKVKLLQAAGMQPHLLNVTASNATALQPALQADIAIVTLPPSSGDDQPQFYLRQLQNVAEAIALSPVSKVLFTSATAVYPQANQAVVEADAVRIESPFSDTPWLDIEQAFSADPRFVSTIVRFAGLIGGDYQPGRYFSGKPLSGADDPVNMIHRDDCIGVIRAIIEHKAWGDTFNACADQHPSRRALYGASCAMAQLPPPLFNTQPKPYRLINCDKLKQRLGYRFIHPDPVAALGI
ncbi:NAD(P)-binding domain-containing protein [uncultured Ferrimonas sp.]|uniref:NAD(P)-binding domain-containing protein n=1 Tax=uncultured Ferrimonas sp. TaxID=432640 RepID=UPI00261EF521|nr:NAD(P)-binding domain-containing protein [uncultured Ferrimonas sp.]